MNRGCNLEEKADVVVHYGAGTGNSGRFEGVITKFDGSVVLTDNAETQKAFDAIIETFKNKNPDVKLTERVRPLPTFKVLAGFIGVLGVTAVAVGIVALTFNPVAIVSGCTFMSCAFGLFAYSKFRQSQINKHKDDSSKGQNQDSTPGLF